MQVDIDLEIIIVVVYLELDIVTGLVHKMITYGEMKIIQI
jgi:hypothetical protein